MEWKLKVRHNRTISWNWTNISLQLKNRTCFLVILLMLGFPLIFSVSSSISTPHPNSNTSFVLSAFVFITNYLSYNIFYMCSLQTFPTYLYFVYSLVNNTIRTVSLRIVYPITSAFSCMYVQFRSSVCLCMPCVL